jgi:hypothetical protein
VEEDERWVKMVAKVELQILGCWGVYIGERSAILEENRGIKSLSSLHIFPERDHTGRMQVHTGFMLFFVAANDLCYPRGTSIGVEAQFGTRFLSSLA